MFIVFLSVFTVLLIVHLFAFHRPLLFLPRTFMFCLLLKKHSTGNSIFQKRLPADDPKHDLSSPSVQQLSRLFNERQQISQQKKSPTPTDMWTIARIVASRTNEFGAREMLLEWAPPADDPMSQSPPFDMIELSVALSNQPEDAKYEDLFVDPLSESELCRESSAPQITTAAAADAVSSSASQARPQHPPGRCVILSLLTLLPRMHVSRD
jgi:hypothetical protein